GASGRRRAPGMSGFWDAVDRAVLGLPGEAGPRPRSLFEPDHGLETGDGFDIVEQDQVAPVTPYMAAPAVSAPLGDGAAAPEPGVLAHAPQPALGPPADDDGAPPPADIPHEAQPSFPAIPTDQDGAPPAPQLHPRDLVHTFDVRRIETVRTVLEAHEV